MPNYLALSKETEEKIREDRLAHRENPYACKNEAAIRRRQGHDAPTLIRPSFVRDIQKIMNVPYYVRYSDKTQVFSLMKNDDISRRSYHVQLVSRIARNIGEALQLNLDLIEAIALGHDIGHTPFGHAGERKLSEIFQERTGKYFNHNIQSARVLDTIFPVNLSLQTLDGIICHNGEMELMEYRPVPYTDFAVFDKKMETCIHDQKAIKKLVPATLEGCVVRVSDIIAYLGKDRQDAMKLGFLQSDAAFSTYEIGSSNAEIINNMTVNLVENSYGKPYLKMDQAYFDAFSKAKKENYEMIYQVDSNLALYEKKIYPMFDAVYEKLLSELRAGNKDSVIFTHHLDYVRQYAKYYQEFSTYELEDMDDIVVDFIASMTDDFFIDLYHHYFPNEREEIAYKGYF